MRGWLIAPLSLALLAAACSSMKEQRASTGSGSSRGDTAVASQPSSSDRTSSSPGSSSATTTRPEGSAASAGTSSDRAAAGTSGSRSSASARSAAPNMSKDELRQVQTDLKSMGLYDGEVDGLWGPRTRAAVGKFQEQNKLPQTYALDSRTRQQLQGKSGSAGSQPGSQIGETPSAPSGTMEAPPIEAPPAPR
jgi:peptidoglycan hydrolase-like protein with peptidoglycan-binding domain